MKDKIEQLISLNKEIKTYCYHLANKWSEYRKSLDPVVTDYECGIHNYVDMNINELTFGMSDGENPVFEIGYQYCDRCGDTETFYTGFTKKELLDENLIKERIDKIHEYKFKEREKENENRAKRKGEKEQKEFEKYLELKAKFENN